MVGRNLPHRAPSGWHQSHFEDVFSVFWKHGYKSYTVGRERRAVGPEDIRRWVRARSRDFGGYNYEFTG